MVLKINKLYLILLRLSLQNLKLISINEKKIPQNQILFLGKININ